jgi:TP901-1 family phage major tail protein
MAGHNGRSLTIDWDTTTIVGVRTRGVSVTNDYVDVTTDDDNGWRTLLANPGLRAVEVTVGGITNDEILLAAIMAANVAVEAVAINLPTGLATPGDLGGDFLISGFEQSADHDGACEFSVTLMSTGEIVYTASSS